MSSFFVPRNAREWAFAALNRDFDENEFASQRLELAAGNHVFSATDRRLAMALAHGVIRRQGTLDSILKRFVRRGQSQVEPALWTILRLGAFQLILMDGIPDHAAVHETVELARRVGRGGWPGFVNGVLRSISKLMTTDIVDHPAADAVPISNGRYRHTLEPVFADPEQSFIDYWAPAFSFPEWLGKRWQQTQTAADLIRLGNWFNSTSYLTLRVNSLRTSRDQYLELLRQREIDAEVGTLPEAIRLSESIRVEELPHFADGWFTVQDESSMHAAHLIAPQAGERILDLCAAPGGKTTHLAELMGDGGQIVAVDVQSERLAVVRENASRLCLKSIRTSLMSKTEFDCPEGPFDAVLVDVPCSNTGVIGKRPEVRWRISPRDFTELPVLQVRLLQLAIHRTRPGGRVVYSTCSIDHDENRAVIDQVLAQDPLLRLVEERIHVPGQPADGAYQALIQR